MIWRHVAASVALAAALLVGGPATAAAAPATGNPGVSSQTAGSLPAGFPADLKQFVGGTDEFRAGPWFSGECKDRGGDMGLYINAAMAAEDRLMYWSADPEAKTAILTGASGRAPQAGAAVGGDEQAMRHYVEAGLEPPRELLPRVFPAGDPAYSLRTGYCADDLKRWATPEWNAWGFRWASAPDKQSMTDITKMTGFDRVPAQAWNGACGGSVPGTYCSHAFFVNCDQANSSPDDLRRCVAWNRSVAQLFAGTAQWTQTNTSLSDRLGQALESTPQFKLSTAYAQAFAWMWGTAVPNTIKFVADPQSVIDDWADASKQGAVDLSIKVLNGLADTGGFDPAAPWFLRWYALSTGVGVVVMGLMTILALWRAAAKGETIKSIGGDLLGYAPAGIVLMMFAPMLAQMLVEVSNLLSQAITRTSGPDMGQMITNVNKFVGELTSNRLPGGVIVGLILFLLLIAGALGVFFGLLMQANALPVLAVAAGIGFGMWVHPRWRPKALRPVLVFIGVVFSKPLLFLLLAVESALINAELTGQSAAQGDTGNLGKLAMIVASFIVVGLAPWSLVKYAPLLPTRSDAAGFGAHSGSLLAGALGGVATSRMGYGLGRGGYRDRSPRPGSEPAATGKSGGGRGGGGGDPGPKWRTAGRGDGLSATEARFGNMLHRRSAPPAGGGAAAKRAKNGGRDGSWGRDLGRGLARGAGSAAALAVPVAAQASAAALNKARAAAESGPGEAEQQQ
ncbi:hypothetical protein [Nocardia gipuzkoensis]|uniref:hypothetical protein n=1 Tax=Nocardia gipuzkoensis TaxID=2749991 RepID=UPI00237E3553|nr:hypothetical protein [Nocardia gipuzkoensis]MDE1672650.1 hypothetical protein [Nocardia gipuzkoensis]